MLALVVDDKEENLYLLQALLAANGYQVQAARNGAEALALASKGPPDLVISDILMPVMDGFSLCRRWKQDPALRDVPFVFYTATYTEPKDEHLALSLGAERFIIKPQEPARFLALIAEVMEAHRCGRIPPRRTTAAPEPQYLREYNEVLVHKLEDKLVQLEEANRALSAKDSFNQAVLNATAALVAVVAEHGEILAVNCAWSNFARQTQDSRLFLLRVGDNILSALESANPAGALGRLREGLREVLAHHSREREVELPYGNEDDPRWFMVRIERVGAAGAAAVVAFIDVTGRRRAEQLLAEAAQRKDEFLGLLGHELRNPLAPIRNASYVLKQLGSGDPRAERATQVIDRQVAHLAHIVSDLLDVSRIARGKMVLARRPTDWVQLARATAEDLRPSFDARGIALQLRLPTAPAWVDGDSTRLAQVVSDLLSNALNFTDRGGRVEVCLAGDEREGRSSLVVRDTGIGMTEETIARIFQPFEQAPQSSARTRGGLGMGLALVKGIVEMHGGEVLASSAGPGRGSQFEVRLPLTRAAAAPGPSAAPAGAEGARVLVIEDNRDAADSLQALLTMAGCRVDVAYDGASGLALTRALAPETVLCDIGLPGELDGYAVARAVRHDSALRSTQLVALTGYGQAEDLRRAREAGFDSHVTKPADPQELLGLVARSHERAPAPQ